MSSISGKSKPCLDGLPPELVDRIAEDLDLASICSLRLACRAICDRTYGPRFRSFFENQQTNLTSKRLERLCRIASHPKLGPAVQSLVVLAVIYDTTGLNRMLKTKRRRIFKQQGVFSATTELEATEEELEEAQQNLERLPTQMAEQNQMMRSEADVQLLAAALDCFGQLATLAVEAAVVQNPGEYVASSAAREWHPVWIRAAQVYRTVTLAIARSNVTVDSLQIYEHSKRCSVPTWDVNEHIAALDNAKFAQAATHLQSLSLSVSTKVETDSQKVADARAKLSGVDRANYEAGIGPQAGLLSDEDLTAVAEENYPGVARLLKQMPNLERLDLHLYKTRQGAATAYAGVFSCIANGVVLPRLQYCALRGLYSDEASLLTFLRAHGTIVTLEIREMHLVSGSWAPVFAHLCTMPSLQQITLQNLWAPGRGVMNLAPKHRPHEENSEIPFWEGCQSYPCLGGGRTVHTRIFSREEVQTERFEFAERHTGRQLGSRALYQWRDFTRAEYGPPQIP